MVHQASNPHHTQQVLEEVPVDMLLMVVLVVVTVPHHTNHQEELVVVVLVLVLMLLLLLSILLTKIRMVLLIKTNFNNSTKVVYKKTLLYNFHTFFYTLCLKFSFSF